MFVNMSYHTTSTFADRECERVRNLIFDAEKINISKGAFKEWLQIQSWFIHAEHAKYPLLKTRDAVEESEQEYPWSLALRNERFNLLGPVVNFCLTPLESFGVGDQEKRACGVSTLLLHEDGCHVFSIGSANEWNFEEDIVSKTKCFVETFDCTVGPNAKPPYSIAHRVRLHRHCLGDKDEIINDRSFLSWSSMHQLVNSSAAPILLKMDIEGYEYPVIRSIIEDGRFMPMQILVEIHLHVMATDFKRTVSSAELVTFFNYLLLLPSPCSFSPQLLAHGKLCSRSCKYLSTPATFLTLLRLRRRGLLRP